MNLPSMIQAFVLHFDFGEMGSRWGTNGTVGQIYALLYVSQMSAKVYKLYEMKDKLFLVKGSKD